MFIGMVKFGSKVAAGSALGRATASAAVECALQVGPCRLSSPLLREMEPFLRLSVSGTTRVGAGRAALFYHKRVFKLITGSNSRASHHLDPCT